MSKWRAVIGYFLSQTPSETPDAQKATINFCGK